MPRREYLRVKCLGCGRCEDVPVEMERQSLVNPHMRDGLMIVVFKTAEVPHACKV